MKKLCEIVSQVYQDTGVWLSGVYEIHFFPDPDINRVLVEARDKAPIKRPQKNLCNQVMLCILVQWMFASSHSTNFTYSIFNILSDFFVLLSLMSAISCGSYHVGATTDTSWP